jgi:retinol dehydrogenase 14
MDQENLQNKIVLVTGANRGIGYTVATSLALKGARVVMLCRDTEGAGKAKTDILKQKSDAQLDVVKCDLSDLFSVKAAIQIVSAKYKTIDGIINNAGNVSGIRSETAQGYELHFGVSYIGHYYLTRGLVGIVNDEGSIVNVTSVIHRYGKIDLSRYHLGDAYQEYGLDIGYLDILGHRIYLGPLAYAQTKWANLYFTYELARRLASQHETVGQKIHVNCVDPGLIKTDIGKKDRSYVAPIMRALAIVPGLFIDPVKGAERVMAALFSEGSGGLYVNELLKGHAQNTYAFASSQLWNISEAIIKDKLGENAFVFNSKDV